MSDTRVSNLSGLKRRLAALFAITAAAVITGAVAYNNNYRSSLIKDSEKLLLSIEDFKIQQIIYWQNDRLEDTVSLLDSPILSTYLRNFAANPSEAGIKSTIHKRLVAYVKNNRYTEAALLGPDGRVLASAGLKTKNVYPEAKVLILKATASGRPEMGDLDFLPGDEVPHIDLVARATTGPAGRNLFLLLRIDPRDYIYPLIEKWPTNSRSGETLIIKRTKDKVIYLNELRHLKGAAFKFQLPIGTPRLPAAIAFTGKPGIVRGRDYRGTEVLAAVSTIPGTNWAMVAKMDMAEVLEGSGRVSLLLLLLTLSLLGAAGAGAYLIFRRQAEEYLKSYAELNRQTSKLKDYYERLTAQANDAIIIADAGTLRIIETNRKSHEMYGYTEEEFLRLKLSDLVPGSGLAAQKERVETIRSRSGAVVEAEHKRKNGELFPAEISSACTSSSGEEFIFAIVRDLSERKRLEQTLRDSEENYRELFEAESDAIFLIDNTTGGIKQANNAAAALYGYTHEELLVLRNTDLSAEPEDTTRVTRTTPLDADKVVVIPMRYHRKKNGEIFPVEITGRFFTRNGRPVHIVAIRDITERQKALEKLRQGEERLRMAAEAARFGAYSYDFETGQASYSPQFLGLYGLPPEAPLELDAELAPEALHPEDRADFLKAMRAGNDPDGTGIFELEYRAILPSGQLRWLKVQGRTIFTGTGRGARPLRANGIIQDVTERKQAEMTLRESEDRYRSLFENMLNGLAYCRMHYEGDKPADFVYLSVNKAFETLTGLKDAAGRKVSDLIPDIRETDPDLLERYGRVARGGKPESFETYVKALKLWFSISVYSPAKDHFLAVFEIITERKRAEAALEKLNRDLIEKKHEMENFLYITTHDLRGPLVNILGFSQHLEQYMRELKETLATALLKPEEKETLEKLTGERIPTAIKFVLESSRKLDALINALLKVSRLGQVEMKPETVEMNDLLEKITASMRYQLEEAGGAIKRGGLPTCKADPGAISQLFTNLLDNAIKYRQEGRPLAVNVSGEIKDGMAFYSVRDNGSGIPEKDLARIWDIFYRSASAPEKNGEGIGLPMVKRIAEKNGGRITVESRLGEGSVFYVSLPSAEGK